jgi:hypothetical protein
LLCLVVLSLTAVLLAGFAAGLSLPGLPLSVPKWYLLLRNGIWGLSGIVAAVGLFFGLGWGLTLTQWWGGILSMWYWCERLLIARSEFTKRSWPAALCLTILGLTWMLWLLNRPGVRSYFTERDV